MKHMLYAAIQSHGSQQRQHHHTLCCWSQVNGGFEADADVGPMITPEAKARCEQLIQSGIDQVGQPASHLQVVWWPQLGKCRAWGVWQGRDTATFVHCNWHCREGI